MLDNERPAQGVRGMLLRHQDPKNPLIFRVYSEDKKTYKDYALALLDVAVEITGIYASLFDGGDVYDGKLDYPSKRLPQRGMMPDKGINNS